MSFVLLLAGNLRVKIANYGDQYPIILLLTSAVSLLIWTVSLLILTVSLLIWTVSLLIRFWSRSKFSVPLIVIYLSTCRERLCVQRCTRTLLIFSQRYV